MSKKPYMMLCYSLDTVLGVKRLSPQEEDTLLKKLISTVESDLKNVAIAPYTKALIEQLIVEDVDLLDVLDDLVSQPEHSEKVPGIVGEIYLGLIKIYPNYSLDVIIGIINSSIDPKEADFPTRTSEKDELLEFWKSLGILENLNFEFQEKVESKIQSKREKSKNHSKKLQEQPKPSSIKMACLKDVNSLRKKLKSKIIGQDQAIDLVMDQILGIASGLYSRANLFFVGPTGVGKTELSKVLAEGLFGKKHFYKINCAEYSKGHEVSKLIGSPPGYVGFGDTPILKRLAEKSDQWVILFDEIEKGHQSLYDFALSLLDEGKATDNVGNTLDFTRSVFLFTSNSGMRDLKLGSRKVGFGSEKVEYKNSKEFIMESIRNHFSPEFLGRMDSIIMFNQLSKEDIRKIAKIELDLLPIKKTKALVDYVVSGGYSAEYGARYLARYIKSEVAPVVAEALLSFRIPEKSDKYTVRVSKEGLKIPETKEMKNEH